MPVIHKGYCGLVFFALSSPRSFYSPCCSVCLNQHKLIDCAVTYKYFSSSKSSKWIVWWSFFSFIDTLERVSWNCNWTSRFSELILFDEINAAACARGVFFSNRVDREYVLDFFFENEKIVALMNGFGLLLVLLARNFLVLGFYRLCEHLY